MKKWISGFAVVLALALPSFSETVYPPAMDLIDQGSSPAGIPPPPELSGSVTQTDFFPFFLSYFERVYKPLEKQGYVLQSVENDRKDPLSENYAAAIDQFLEINTRDYENVKEETVLTTQTGRRIQIDKIFTTDTDAVFENDTRVPLSTLTPESRLAAREIIGNVIFDTAVRISVDRDSRDTESWKRFDDEGSGFRMEHESYVFTVEMDNTSDIPLKNLILEYQIFFRQSLAGTPKDANDYYRHIGYIPVKELMSQQEQFALRRQLDRDVTEPFPERRLSDREETLREKMGIFTIKPPPISDGDFQPRRRRFILSDGRVVRSAVSPPFPFNFNQDYDSRMLGIWLRLHKISPYGTVKLEYKDDVYPNDAEWDGVRSRIGWY
ncbi:MAG TPA: hypothetical protein VJ904_04115 [Tichowtungia sp.]|nr:hypothetical protein [Tichowtungia sp.]